MTKLCRHCGEEKPLDDFYKHPRMLDGHLNVCKPCVRHRVRRHRRENDHVREYDRRRYQLDPKRRRQSAENAQQWGDKHPEARRAHVKVHRAVRAGKLQKKPCLFCGSEKVHAHHRDYDAPLDVTWLCAKCHHRLHANFPETEGHGVSP